MEFRILGPLEVWDGRDEVGPSREHFLPCSCSFATRSIPLTGWSTRCGARTRPSEPAEK